MTLNKRTLISAFALSALLSISSAASAAPITVAVINDSASTGTGASVVAQLNDSSVFDFDASLISQTSITSVSSLAGFDAVVMGGSGNSTNGYTAAVMAATRGFLEAGGGIVTSGWFRFAVLSMTGQAAADAQIISPVLTNNDYDFVGGGATLDITNSIHPITNGVGNFTNPSNHVETGRDGIDPGAFVLATIAGSPTDVAVVAQDQVGRSVYLGHQFMASASYNNSGLRIGAPDQLLEQAVAWSAFGSSSTPVPAPGALALLGLGLIGLGLRRKAA